MHSAKVELLMGHSLEISDSYIRFTEEQLLDDYLQVVNFLTVNQNIVLINKSLKKQEETIQKSFKEMEEKYKKEIDDLRKEHNEYVRLSEKQELDIARGVNMLDKKLKQQEALNQQLKNIFTIFVDEIGFDKVESVRKSSEEFTLAL